jgi:hypothetical protein
MMTIPNRARVLPVFLIAAGLLMASPAQAALVSCFGGSGTSAYDLRGKVSGSVDCLIDDWAENDQPIPGLVNGDPIYEKGNGKDKEDVLIHDDEQYFGDDSITSDDWMFAGKDNNGGKLGTWSILSVDKVLDEGALPNGASDYQWMLVFKDGGGTTLVAYLLDELVNSGSWGSPFTIPPFTKASGDSPKDVSHISYYYRQSAAPPTNDVSEPGIVALLGIGLVGVGLSRRRRTP